VGSPGELSELLSARVACFVSDLVARTRRLPSDVAEGLWTLAAAGRVTSDSFETLRARVKGSPDRGLCSRFRRRAVCTGRGCWTLARYALEPTGRPN